MMYVTLFSSNTTCIQQDNMSHVTNHLKLVSWTYSVNKSGATVWCCHVNMDQYLWGRVCSSCGAEVYVTPDLTSLLFCMDCVFKGKPHHLGTRSNPQKRSLLERDHPSDPHNLSGNNASPLWKQKTSITRVIPGAACYSVLHVISLLLCRCFVSRANSFHVSVTLCVYGHVMKDML